jgi:hypothetical protein
MGTVVRPWHVASVIANMQCAIPLSFLFSFLAPLAMLRTDCLLLCTQRGARAQPRQQDVRASSNCSLESKSSAFSSSPPLLILCSLLLCALPQHGRYEHAVSFAAGVRAGGWRGAGESRQICSWYFPRHKHASKPIKMPIIFIEARSSHL